MKEIKIKRWKLAQKQEGEFWNSLSFEEIERGFELVEKKYKNIFNDISIRFKPKKIIDVGAGPIPLSTIFSGDVERYAIDPLLSYYENINPNIKEKVNYVKGLIEKTPYQNEFFDCCVFRNVLDHVLSPQRSLEEVHRILKKDGIVILGINIFPPITRMFKKIFEFFSLPGREELHPHFFSERDLCKIMHSLNFEVVERYEFSEPYIKDLKNKIAKFFWTVISFFDNLFGSKNEEYEIIFVCKKI